LLRNTQKRDNTKEVEGKLTSKFLSVFVEKVFDMDFLQKYFMVFLNSPYRENPKNLLLKKKSAGGLVGLRYSKCTGGPSIFLGSALRLMRRTSALHRTAKGQQGVGGVCTYVLVLGPGGAKTKSATPVVVDGWVRG
jgi:hypothetical protein